MPYATTTLSTTAVSTGFGTSNPLSVNWRGGKAWGAVLTISSSAGTGDATIQYTLQDLTSSNIGLAAPTWLNLTPVNGAAGISSVQASSQILSQHYTVANLDIAAGLQVWGSYPIAGIRVASTALSSVTLTLTLIQGEGW